MRSLVRPILAVLVCLLVTGTLSAQRGGFGVKWAGDGNSWYAVESNSIVRYALPGFQRSVVVEASQLVPPGQSEPLPIQGYSFSEDGKKLLVYTNSKKVWRQNTRGDYWVFDLAAHTLKQLGAGRPSSSLMFAKLSPDGTKAAYTSEHNIYVEDLASGAIRQLTTDGAFRMINGTFDWAYEEEFSCRDGFRWSPDGQRIAFWQLDATRVKNFLMIDNTDSLYPFTIPVEYPVAGEAPSPCRVGVIDVATGKTTWMDVPGDDHQPEPAAARPPGPSLADCRGCTAFSGAASLGYYIPRMEWADNSKEVVLEQLNRKQNDAKVFLCDAASGAARQIYEESDSTWIDVKQRYSDDPTG
ncbi:MAG TPA: DPP IV N-terminal domain-containing protein, partial [Puia sp.]|nr:DPP IV N-terminal domain-containing protein [Puia sp.]